MPIPKTTMRPPASALLAPRLLTVFVAPLGALGCSPGKHDSGGIRSLEAEDHAGVPPGPEAPEPEESTSTGGISSTSLIERCPSDTATP